MSEVVLFAKDLKIVDSSGNAVPIGIRPVVRWREKVSFEVRLPNNASFPSDNYHYAFDYDRDFLHTAPCNAGECTLADGKLTFDVVFNSVRQAKETNGRLKPIPFYIQISTLGDTFAEYILDDAIWVDGCVWDGRIPPAPEAPNYYTKAEVDGIADRKLDKPEEAGEDGYVLGLAEDGSTVWIPQSGGGSWGSITGDLSSQTDLADALGGKANLVGGKVPASELPAMDYIPTSEKGAVNGVAGLDSNALVPVANLPDASASAAGVVRVATSYGTQITTGSTKYIATAPSVNGNIDNRDAASNDAAYRPITPKFLDYAVRSVLPNVTTIPAATTAYTLTAQDATTNDHCYCYEHAPESAPTYTLPAVTDATVKHEIILTVRFSASVLTYAFEDSAGNPITPLPLAGTIADGSVVAFRCTWEALLGQWVIMPVMLGTYQEVTP